MKRSKHTLSHYRLLTGKMGQLLPVGLQEVLPGDSFQMSTDALVRVAPLNTPVMHPTTVRIHHWFVPNRIVWDNWEEFITGGKDGNNQDQIPQVLGPDSKNDIKHLLGIPVRTSGSEPFMNSLPLRAFNLIYNEFYRDPDLGAERAENASSIPRISWEKDYLTTARSTPQKGPDVSIPFGDTAEVVTFGDQKPQFTTATTGIGPLQIGNDNNVTSSVQGPTPPGDMLWSITKLRADLSSATAVNVNDLRKAFGIQRYQEARSRYGSRYVEYLRYLGVREPSDARLQRPELLGASETRLNFSEVLQTTPATTNEPGEAGVGDLYGHGIAGVKGNAFRKFFEEHGYIVSLMSVRPKSVYLQSVDRHFLKRTKEDYYQKELEHIGQQEVLKNEVYADQANSVTDVWGYNDRYNEYRIGNSRVSGDFVDTLNTWHMARDYDNSVALNETFTTCNPTDRIYQVQSEDPLWIMVNNHVVARRLVKKNVSNKVM